MLNIAVIGSFWLTDEFIKAVNNSDTVRYYAQYSRTMERAIAYGSERGAAAFYDSLDEMAKDENIDIVYIASPNMLHYIQSKLFIQAGKHIICEKPATVTLEEFRELSALADNKNVIYIEAMMNTHVGWSKELKRITDCKKEEIVSARFDFSQRSSKLERVSRGEHISTFDKNSCGGAMMDLGVYCTSLATYLFGYPEIITAKAHFSENGVDLTDTVLLEYSGFDCTFTISKLCESRARSEILFKNAVITMKNVSQLQKLELWETDEYTLLHGENGFPESMAFEIADMVKYIKGDRKAYKESRELTELSLRLLEEIRDKIGYEIKSKIN